MDNSVQPDRITPRLAAGLVALTLAGVIGVAIALAQYAFPKSDELFRAGRARKIGIPASLRVEYTTWSGRWVGTGIAYTLGGKVNEERWYGLLLTGIAAMTPLAAYVLLGAMFGPALPRTDRAGVALGLLALFWAGMPSPQEGFYWLTGSVENQLPIPLGMLTVAGLLYCSRWTGRGRFVAAIGLALLAATTVGFHELHGLLLVVVLTVGTAVAFAIRHPARWVWSGSMAAAALGLAVVVASPGNAIRMGTMPPGDRTLEQLGIASLVWLGFFSEWLTDPKLWAATVLLVALPTFHAVTPAWLAARRAFWAVTVPAATLIVLSVTVLVVWRLMAEHPAPGRTRSAIYLVFLVGWFASVYVLFSAGRPAGLPGPARLAGVVCLTLALCRTGTFPKAVADLRGPAAQYNRAVRQRHDNARAAVLRAVRDLRVPPLPVIPACFNYDADLVETGSKALNAYVNVHAATYFELESMALATPVAGR